MTNEVIAALGPGLTGAAASSLPPSEVTGALSPPETPSAGLGLAPAPVPLPLSLARSLSPGLAQTLQRARGYDDNVDRGVKRSAEEELPRSEPFERGQSSTLGPNEAMALRP